MQPVTHSVDAVLDQIRSLPQALGLSESSLSVEAGDVFVACAANDETRLQHMETAGKKAWFLFEASLALDRRVQTSTLDKIAFSFQALKYEWLPKHVKFLIRQS